ncbi:MAG: PDDEXK nuclease domain-containing protein [Bacteroidota bacterium]
MALVLEKLPLSIMAKQKTASTSEFENVVRLIQEARTRAYSKVNSELVLLYFNVGKIVSEKVANGVWGQGTVDELAAYIALKMPGMSGFNRRGLYRMKQFSEIYSIDSECFKLWMEIQVAREQNKIVSPPVTQLKSAKKAKPQIVSSMMTQLQNVDFQYSKFVSSLMTQINWTHHLMILSKTKSAGEKLFYLLLAINDKLSVKELERQLNTAVFERTLIGNQNVSTVPTQLPEGIFKDPYIFEFLDLPEGHSETDLEKALIKNLQKFIIEIGKGFAYMGSQFRLQVGSKDYHSDLLFYHRDLQCLVMFELKIEEFQPEFLGKLNFYLEALDRDVKRPHENPSIGVLLCKGKETEVVEYAMARNTSPAMIADYETKLISKKLLADKLHQLVEIFSKEKMQDQ